MRSRRRYPPRSSFVVHVCKSAGINFPLGRCTIFSFGHSMLRNSVLFFLRFGRLFSFFSRALSLSFFFFHFAPFQPLQYCCFFSLKSFTYIGGYVFYSIVRHEPNFIRAALSTHTLPSSDRQYFSLDPFVSDPSAWERNCMCHVVFIWLLLHRY